MCKFLKLTNAFKLKNAVDAIMEKDRSCLFIVSKLYPFTFFKVATLK